MIKTTTVVLRPIITGDEQEALLSTLEKLGNDKGFRTINRRVNQSEVVFDIEWDDSKVSRSPKELSRECKAALGKSSSAIGGKSRLLDERFMIKVGEDDG